MTAISEVRKKHADGKVDYLLRIYLGQENQAEIIAVNATTDELLPRRIRLVQERGDVFWCAEVKKIRPGTGLAIRMEINDGRSIPFVPLSESDVVNGVVRVPDIDPAWFLQNNQPAVRDALTKNGGMRILLEHTLEGLLADYEDGVYFTDAIEEFLDWSIADRIIESKIPELIQDLGYSELMVPIYASVADRCHLDPKFNYLVYNISPDWQLGSAREIRALVHRFRSCDIELVPDLVFVHQVKNPFAGSCDDVSKRTSQLRPYKDENPFLFRDYGTWHFNLQDKTIRDILVDKIIETIMILDLNIIRVDYIDGLLMQYNGKSTNYSRIFLQELKQKINQIRPSLQIIGEAFQTASEPSVQALIDSAYAPRGFALLDLMLAPGAEPTEMLKSCVDGLNQAIQEFNYQTSRESNYCQLHDECWQDEWINIGRPHTPWAYGKMPLGLCLDRIDELLANGLIESNKRIETAVSLMLLIRTLGLTLTFTRWMETTGCLSLDQGRLDERGHWQFPWKPGSQSGRIQFPANGLTSTKREELFNNARQHVSSTNNLLNKIGRSSSNPYGKPLQMVHGDCNSGIAAYVRWGQHYPNPLLVIVNLNPDTSAKDENYKLHIGSSGWAKNQQPKTIKAATLPILGDNKIPLLLKVIPDSGGHYLLNRPLNGFESAVFEVPIHGV